MVIDVLASHDNPIPAGSKLHRPFPMIRPGPEIVAHLTVA